MTVGFPKISHAEHIGLRYVWRVTLDGDEYFAYQPSGTLVVDGIAYRCAGYSTAAMVSIKADGVYLASDAARMRTDRPPTDEELSEWVNYGDRTGLGDLCPDIECCP